MYVNLDSLKTFADGDKEFMVMMIDKFIAEMPKMNGELQQAIDATDWARVGALAHKFKSSVGVFSINEIRNLLQEIENHSRFDANVDKIPGLFEQIKKVSPEVLKELEQQKESL